MTKTGDTYYTDEFVDNVLGTNDGLLEAAAKLYAGNHELKTGSCPPFTGSCRAFLRPF